jgi:hypothetical protein
MCLDRVDATKNSQDCLVANASCPLSNLPSTPGKVAPTTATLHRGRSRVDARILLLELWVEAMALRQVVVATAHCQQTGGASTTREQLQHRRRKVAASVQSSDHQLWPGRLASQQQQQQQQQQKQQQQQQS